MNEPLKFLVGIENISALTGITPKSVFYQYQGVLSVDKINEILEVSEKALFESNERLRYRKKVYNILLEMIQNVFHHSEDLRNQRKSNDVVEPLITVFHYNDQYHLISGNTVENNKIDFINNKIEYINSLSKSERKDYYRQILNNGIISEKGGSGLGLIDMARKSKNDLTNYFVKINSDLSYFVLHVKV